MNALVEQIMKTRSEIDAVKISIDVRATSQGTSVKLNAHFADDVAGALLHDD